MGNEIRAEQLAAEIQKQLKDYTDEVRKFVLDTAMDVSETAVKKLKEKSPKRTGKYARNWTRSIDRNGITVHQKGTTYRLAHLLEKGHQLKCGGRTIGEDVPAYPHIAKVEEECVSEYVAEIERRLEK